MHLILPHIHLSLNLVSWLVHTDTAQHCFQVVWGVTKNSNHAVHATNILESQLNFRLILHNPHYMQNIETVSVQFSESGSPNGILLSGNCSISSWKNQTEVWKAGLSCGLSFLDNKDSSVVLSHYLPAGASVNGHAVSNKITSVLPRENKYLTLMIKIRTRSSILFLVLKYLGLKS